MLRFTLLATVALAALVIGFAPGSVADAACAPNDTVCQQLEQAKQSQANAVRQLQDIQQGVASAQTKAVQTQAIINQLNAQIAAQQAKIAQTQAKLAATQRQIEATEAEIARQEANLAARKALLAQRVRVMDERGTADYMQVFVTSRNFNELVDRVAAMQTIIQNDQKLVDTLKRQRDQIKQLRQSLQGEHDQETAMLQQQLDQQAQVQQTQAAQQQALGYYQQLAVQLDAQRVQLEAQKAQIDAQIGKLQAQFDAQAQTVGGGSGRFAWPERGPITQPFGCTDFAAEPYNANCPGLHFHTGLDIGARGGTPIGAADNGIVSLVNTDGWGGGYGNYVIVTHGNGYATLYAHLSSVAVSVKQAVRQGQTIGTEGSTGNSTGPHLHFEIRLNGAYQNPLAYLP